MAKEYLLRCDRCDKRGSDKIVVHSLDVRLETGDHFTADLCPACWSKMTREFSLEEVRKQARKRMQLIDPADIPKG